MKFEKINYDDLNARQQENYNYHKVAAVLADFGYTSILLSDDWNGADFLAVHKDGSCIKIQLKSRMTFEDKYFGKDLHICFPEDGNWYIYPHDQIFNVLDSDKKISTSKYWAKDSKYSSPQLSERHKILLQPYIVPQQFTKAA